MTTTTPPKHVLPSGTIDVAAFAFNVAELAELARQAERDHSAPLHLCDGLSAAFTDMATEATKVPCHPAIRADLDKHAADFSDAANWSTIAVTLDAFADRLQRLALAELDAEASSILENDQ